MLRVRKFLVGRVGPPLLAALLLALLFTGFGVAYAVHTGNSQGATATTADESACYTWEAANLTGSDADALHVTLSGVQSVTQVYDGEANPLGDPVTGSGYDASTDSYAVVLGPNDATVAPAETVRLGVCVPTPITAARYSWSATGQDLGQDTQLPQVDWQWQDANTLDLALTNSTGVTMTLLALQALDPGEPLALEDLDATVNDDLPVASVALDEPIELSPGAVLTATVGLDALPSGSFHTAVIEAQWAEGDDLAVVNTFLAQTSGPAGNLLYLPSVLR